MAAGLAAACRPDPPPAAPLPSASAPVVDAGRLIACGGGQLCEDSEPFGPWRIPAGCRRTHVGRYLATCWLPVADWSKVQEFFVTRYPASHVTPEELTVVTAVADVPHRAPTPARLQVLRRLEGVDIRALAGDTPTVDASAPLP